MIEEKVREYLLEALNIPVLLEYPKEVSERFVVFEIVDRQKNDYIDAVTIEFNSYADSKLKAAQLDKDVRRLIEEIIEDDQISGIEFGGGSSGDRHDESMKRYRYRCYYNFFYYEED